MHQSTKNIYNLPCKPTTKKIACISTVAQQTVLFPDWPKLSFKHKPYCPTVHICVLRKPQTQRGEGLQGCPQTGLLLGGAHCPTAAPPIVSSSSFVVFFFNRTSFPHLIISIFLCLVSDFETIQFFGQIFVQCGKICTTENSPL